MTKEQLKLKKAIISKERTQLFSIQQKTPEKYNTFSAGCKLNGQNSFISQAFFVQVNPHKDVLFKSKTGEIESSNAIKPFNKNENK